MAQIQPAQLYKNDYTETARHALVQLSIESALLGYDVNTYEKVAKLLKERHGCTFADCYRHPEYLNITLQMLPSKSRYHVLNSVRKTLAEFSHIASISEFLNKIDK